MFEHFCNLDSFGKSSYVLGSEAWEEWVVEFTLCLVYGRKGKLGYMANIHQSHSHNDSGDLRGVSEGMVSCGVCGRHQLCYVWWLHPFIWVHGSMGSNAC